ncbi:GAF domain protein [Mycobacterium kansasii]|uniref:GAF domain protein n=1 Tax=Mycobacterium kansasii TaxID=1768 RepID=A0A1V3XQN6_MYCKA|nr:GAF domain protein [Mycobacterium kansasii]
MFRLVAEEALKLTAADAALVAIPLDENVPAAEVTEVLVIETVGSAVAPVMGQVISLTDTVLADVCADSSPKQVEKFELDGVDVAGPALLLPLRATDTCAGVVVLLRHDSSGPATEDQLEMMAAFSDQAALALQLAGSQRRMRELDVVTERDRIARDLHDHVIQRLFAVGLALQAAVPGRGFRKCSNDFRKRSTICRGSSRRSAPRFSTCTEAHRASPGSGSESMPPSPNSPDRDCGPPCNSSARCRLSTTCWPITPRRWSGKRSATPSATRGPRH